MQFLIGVDMDFQLSGASSMFEFIVTNSPLQSISVVVEANYQQ